MPNSRALTRAIFCSPLLWGGCATAGFYSALSAGYLNEPHVQRYLAGHWAAYVATSMFFVACAAIVFKAFELSAQFDVLKLSLFDAIALRGQPVSDCAGLLDRLAKQPDRVQRSYLLERLRTGLEYVQRKNSTDSLEDELRSLSDLDISRKQASYGLVRMMIWAIPFIGSLGTVVGIGTAVASLAPDPSGDFVSQVVQGLAMVFDTTALALGLSVLLMLAMFACDQVETRLLSAVDARVGRELVGRFRGETVPKHVGQAGLAPGNLPELLSGVVEKIVERQTELWKASMEAANKQWEERTEILKQQLSGGGGAAGGAAAGIAGSQLAGDAGQFKEALLSIASGRHSGISLRSEVMQELVLAIAEGSLNWPARKALRSKAKRGASPGNAASGWLEAA